MYPPASRSLSWLAARTVYVSILCTSSVTTLAPLSSPLLTHRITHTYAQCLNEAFSIKPTDNARAARIADEDLNSYGSLSRATNQRALDVLVHCFSRASISLAHHHESLRARAPRPWLISLSLSLPTRELLRGFKSGSSTTRRAARL